MKIPLYKSTTRSLHGVSMPTNVVTIFEFLFVVQNESLVSFLQNVFSGNVNRVIKAVWVVKRLRT